MELAPSVLAPAPVTVEDVLTFVQGATDEERQRIHMASAPPSATVTLQTDRERVRVQRTSTGGLVLISGGVSVIAEGAVDFAD